MVVLLFVVTTVNYMDRQVLSLTWKDFIAPEFHWSDNDYGTITAFFSIFGGYLPKYFVEKKGMHPYAGRMLAMLIFAFFPLLALFAQPMGQFSAWWPAIIIGLAGAAFSFIRFEGQEAGYMIVFCICAVAYLIAWAVMKALVPRYRKIEE
jgi:ACS family hexuronate transporter-like MFS transporter